MGNAAGEKVAPTAGSAAMTALFVCVKSPCPWLPPAGLTFPLEEIAATLVILQSLSHAPLAVYPAGVTMITDLNSFFQEN